MYLKCAVDNFVHLRIWSVQWIICVAYFDNLYSCISRGEKSRIYHKCHFLYCLLTESSSSLLNYKNLSKSYWECKTSSIICIKSVVTINEEYILIIVHPLTTHLCTLWLLIMFYIIFWKSLAERCFTCRYYNADPWLRPLANQVIRFSTSVPSNLFNFLWIDTFFLSP
jgi:hypothetical protein